MTDKDKESEKTKTDEKQEIIAEQDISEKDESKSSDYAIARVRKSNSGQKIVTVPRYCEKIQSGNYVKITKLKDEDLKTEDKKVEKNDSKDE